MQMNINKSLPGLGSKTLLPASTSPNKVGNITVLLGGATVASCDISTFEWTTEDKLILVHAFDYPILSQKCKQQRARVTLAAQTVAAATLEKTGEDTPCLLWMTPLACALCIHSFA
jgi:hypothetical protein